MVHDLRHREHRQPARLGDRATGAGVRRRSRIWRRCGACIPGIYTSDGGFYDAVNPVTGEVGHRRLVLDQSMIMAALDDALNGGAMQKHFAADPESYAARLYLGAEHDVDPLAARRGACSKTHV